MNELLAKLKRLFQPTPRPSESVGEATTDRPPPLATADRPPPPVTEPPPRAAEPLPIEPTPARETASVDADDLAEVRAALDAVAAAPATTHQAEAEPTEPEAFGPEPIEREPAEPEPTDRVAQVPELFPESTADEPAADIIEPAPDHVPASSEEPASSPEPSTRTAPTPETVVVPAQAGRVGDALVLTLGTPPVTFTVAKTSATLGRGQENTIRLDDLSVSRRHARIAYRQGGYWISDLGSMGGTWVEGTRLNAPRRLAAGEVIDIGLLRLTVGRAGGAAQAETTSAKAETTSARAETRKNSKPRSEIAGQVRRRR